MVVQMKVDGSNNESGRSSLCSRDRPFSIFGAFISLIVRLNSEDFSNFLWCLDIIFSTYYYERTHKNLAPRNSAYLSCIFRLSSLIHDRPLLKYFGPSRLTPMNPI